MSATAEKLRPFTSGFHKTSRRSEPNRDYHFRRHLRLRLRRTNMRKVLFLFGQLGDGDVEWLRRHGQTRLLDPAEVLIERGASLASIFIVLAGYLTVSVDGGVIARLGPGEIVGEMSFVDSRPPSATVASEGVVLVLALPRQTVSDHLAANPLFAARFFRAIALFLSDRLRAMEPAHGGRAEAPDEVGVLDNYVLDGAQEAGLRFDRLVQAAVQARGYGP